MTIEKKIIIGAGILAVLAIGAGIAYDMGIFGVSKGNNIATNHGTQRPMGSGASCGR